MNIKFTRPDKKHIKVHFVMHGRKLSFLAQLTGNGMFLYNSKEVEPEKHFANHVKKVFGV